MKKIVVPGELVTEEPKRAGENVFVRQGKIYSTVLGLVDAEHETANVVALQGKYLPVQGDLIVGIVQSEVFSGYRIDISSFYMSFLSKKMTRAKLEKGSVISAKIVDVDEINEAELDDVRVFYGGEVMDISSVKVPRLIGKNGSMLAVLKNGTGSSIMVGRNGRIWAKDGNLSLLKKAIEKIERESHLSNLTNRIQAFLDEENKKTTEKKVM